MKIQEGKKKKNPLLEPRIPYRRKPKEIILRPGPDYVQGEHTLKSGMTMNKCEKGHWDIQKWG